MKKKNQNTDSSMAHVLYQKLGAEWYAFTEVDGDLFMGKVNSAEVPEGIMEQQSDFLQAAEKNYKAA